MEHEPLTYFEKIENVYVLMETQKMLEAKLNELKTNDEQRLIVEDDLRKINDEIHEYTGGLQVEPNQMIVSSLFNPGVFEEQELQ